MNGEFTILGEGILLAIALLFSTTLVAIGRRIPSPASVAAYGTAVAILVHTFRTLSTRLKVF